MKILKRLLFSILIFFTAFLALFFTLLFPTTRFVLMYAFESFYDAFNYKKDVNKDPQKGWLVGKKFELLDDVYFYKYDDDSKYYLSKTMLWSRKEDETSFLNPNVYPFLKELKKGKVLSITNVLVEANLFDGETLYRKTIYADFEEKNGKKINANVTHLFQNTSEIFTGEWKIIPENNLLKELLQ